MEHPVTYSADCTRRVVAYHARVPRLWSETIEEHRRDVRTAILDAAMALVTERGPAAVTMSQIAEGAGIGRGTLYRYFPDVESILTAWHDGQVAAHIAHLEGVREDSPGDPLAAVLSAYAHLLHQRPHGTGLAALVHRGEHLAGAQDRLHDLLRELLDAAARTGRVRSDTSPDELADWCLHALTAVADAPSPAAVQRLVAVTLSGLRSAD